MITCAPLTFAVRGSILLWTLVSLPVGTLAETAPEHTDPVDVLSFLVLTLVLGVFTLHLLAFTKVPYTALLLIWGIIIGICVQTFAQHFKLLGPGTRLWENIDPELLLAVFLPIILFGGAFALQWHLVRKLIWSSLLLAGPGVFLGTALLAVLVKYTFPYNWRWVECLLFGAAFSATDPVAVIAVLREAGLSPRLRTLVDCEALFNDGSAYVLFYLLQTWAEKRYQSVGRSFRLFAQLTAGGPATGLAFGMATTVWLRFMYNTPLGEITLTIASAFGTYLVGAELFGVSGVLAVVTLGIWMAAFGKHHISAKVQHPLEIIWEELEFIANTLIFVLSGAIIAGNIYEGSKKDNPNSIRGVDYLYALLLWVYLLVIRVIMLALAYPFLRNMGYGITAKECIVLSWAGLRGAVGLSLALIVYLDTDIGDARFSILTFFYMGAQAFLTVVIQGTSTPLLLRALGMTKPPSVRRAFLHHVLRTTEEHGEGQLRFAEGDKVLGDPHWPMVRQLTLLDTASLLKRYVSKVNLSTHALPHLDLGEYERHVALQLNRSARLIEGRARILNAVRQTYVDFLHDTYISGQQLYHLQDSADRAGDHLDVPLGDWAHLRRACRVPRLVKRFVELTHASRLGSQALRLLFTRLEHSATLALAFVHAHELAVRDMTTYGELAEWDAETEREQAEAARVGVAVHLDDIVELMRKNVTQQVIGESRAQRRQALQYIAAMRGAFPEVLRAIKTLQLSQEMLVFKEAYLAEVGKTGLLDEVELDQLQNLVEKKFKRLHFNPPQLPHTDPSTSLAAHPLFADIAPHDFQSQVLRHAKLEIFADLMAQHASVGDVAWRSCGVALALGHGQQPLSDLDSPALTELFRQARVETGSQGSQLRIAGGALLVTGTLGQSPHSSSPKHTPREQFVGPCLLPPTPAVFSCVTLVRVLHLPPTLNMDALEKAASPKDAQALENEELNAASLGPRAQHYLNALRRTSDMLHQEHVGPSREGFAAQNPLHSLFTTSAAQGPTQQNGTVRPGSVADQSGESMGLVKRRNLATGLNMGHIDPLSPRGTSFTSTYPSQSAHRQALPEGWLTHAARTASGALSSSRTDAPHGAVHESPGQIRATHTGSHHRGLLQH
ncbi:hypothetical protein WJX73_006506 [Symbiochloris irregularis]|uniref:Cation/H+ exchanger transmembrane domain-containing protein n=1 Tax=Symbiochloris irregularis TaxID=706552 RepID=A0AAW1NSK1_9CHLO